MITWLADRVLSLIRSINVFMGLRAIGVSSYLMGSIVMRINNMRDGTIILVGYQLQELILLRHMIVDLTQELLMDCHMVGVITHVFK